MRKRRALPSFFYAHFAYIHNNLNILYLEKDSKSRIGYERKGVIYMLGIIRVLTSEGKVLSEHGELMRDFLSIDSETKCIMDQPKGIYNAQTEQEAIPKIVELARGMEKSGKYKALTISCAADPALQEVKQAVSIPVYGAGAVGANISKTLGDNVGVIGITEEAPPNILKVLGNHFYSYHYEPTLRNTVSLFSDDAKNKLVMLMNRMKEEGADVILFACTGFSTIHLKQFAKDRVTIPMVDLVEAQAVAYKLQ